jgi:hypothetical protein
MSHPQALHHHTMTHAFLVVVMAGEQRELWGSDGVVIVHCCVVVLGICLVLHSFLNYCHH